MHSITRSSSVVGENHGMIAQILIPVLDTNVQDAAWYYSEPYEKALNIKDHIAFCEFVLISVPNQNRD